MKTRKKIQTYTTPLLIQHRRLTRARRNRSFLSKGRRLMILLGLLASTLLMTAVVLFSFFYSSLTSDLPPVALIPAMLDPQSGTFFEPTQFYDRTGQQVIYTLENPGIPRRYLFVDPDQPEHFSPRLIQVVVALTEPGFWSSPGFSWRHITRTEKVTIAEQLASSLLLHQETPGLRTALRMRLLGAQLTAEYGRVKVLEWYLNSASFGHLAYGADQAAHLYLGKSAASLNLTEAALLGSLLSTPSLNPLDAPQAAFERTTGTLEQLEASGLFAPEDIREAHAAELSLAVNETDPEMQSDFILYILKQARGLVGQEQLERGGWRVITTMDAGLQEQFLCTLQVQIDRLEDPQAAGFQPPESCPAAYLLPTRTQGANPSLASGSSGKLIANAILMDPATSEILAWTGQRSSLGAASETLQYQAGSLLTPFVAAAAFARGFSPASLVWDIPPAVSTQNDTAAQPVQNSDGIFHGPMHLRRALANDYLVPIIRLGEAIGYENIWLLSETLGLQDLDRERMREYLETGSAPVTILQVAQAYSTFANTGFQTGIASDEEGALQPAAILRIEDLYGRLLFEQEQMQVRTLLTPGLAYLVHDVISDTIARRPSLGHPNALEIGRPSGAKTGWVSTGTQAWTVGYTPGALAVVWMGVQEEGREELTGSISPDMPAGIWHAAMQYSGQTQAAEGWERPDEIVQRSVCTPSGQLPTAACPVQVTELFLPGSEPVVADTLYQVVAINRETGRLATVFTPLEKVEEKVFFIPPPAYQTWAYASGYPQPPSDYDLIQEQEPPPNVEISHPAPFSYVRDIVNIRGTAAGDDFVAYRIQVGQGLNPRSWLQLGEESDQTAQRSLLAAWDTRSLDGLYVIRLTVLRTRNRLETHVIQVSVDNTPPSAFITYPEAGAEIIYQPGSEILFLASAEDAVGIAQMEWVLDGKPAGESIQAPYFLKRQLSPGAHTLQVQVTDQAGNTTLSPVVAFTAVQSE